MQGDRGDRAVVASLLVASAAGTFRERRQVAHAVGGLDVSQPVEGEPASIEIAVQRKRANLPDKTRIGTQQHDQILGPLQLHCAIPACSDRVICGARLE